MATMMLEGGEHLTLVSIKKLQAVHAASHPGALLQPARAAGEPGIAGEPAPAELLSSLAAEAVEEE